MKAQTKFYKKKGQFIHRTDNKGEFIPEIAPYRILQEVPLGYMAILDSTYKNHIAVPMSVHFIRKDVVAV